ncbi:MAG: DUF177 domain-containing protein [Pseudomonadota bacterium]
MASQAANAVATVVLSEAAERQEQVSVHYGAAELPRLAALVEEAAKDAAGGEVIAPDVCAVLSFSEHEAPSFVAVSVQIKGVYTLPCQRCLELVAVNVKIDQQLAVGDGLDGTVLEALEADFEQWDLEGDSLALVELVDELVMLDLPLVVAHATLEDCGPLATQLAGDDVAAVSQRPFAGLQALMADNDKQDN